jgi:hypothetical protein
VTTLATPSLSARQRGLPVPEPCLICCRILHLHSCPYCDQNLIFMYIESVLHASRDFTEEMMNE